MTNTTWAGMERSTVGAAIIAGFREHG